MDPLHTAPSCDSSGDHGRKFQHRNGGGCETDAFQMSYGDGADFWNIRYEEPGIRDWILTWGDVEQIWRRTIERSTPCRILHAGCGNSVLHEEMHRAGYCDITNIDSSDVVIEQMASRAKEQTELRFLCMDATQMEFPDGCFDVVIEKGLLAAVICGQHGKINGAMYLKEVIRVLSPGGIFFCICLRDRLPVLESWKFDIIEIVRLSSSSVVHVCRKTEASDALLTSWPDVLTALRRGVDEDDFKMIDAEGQWGNIDNIEAGHVVRVINEFSSDESIPAEQVVFHKGLRGIVKIVDDDGDAIIRFPRLDVSDKIDRIVMHANFHNLEVRRPLGEEIEAEVVGEIATTRQVLR